MKYLIMEKSNIICLVLVIFLFIYNVYHSRTEGKPSKITTMLLAIIGHIIFGIITEITVNISASSYFLNDISHFILYLTALIVAVTYVRFICIESCIQGYRKYMISTYILAAIGVILFAVGKFDYAVGVYTNYSIGWKVYICYGIVILMFINAGRVLWSNRNHVDSTFVTIIMLIMIIAIAIEAVQIIVPEFLCTEIIMTFMAFAVFLSVADPVKYIKEKTSTDEATGVYNKNRYQDDCRILQTKKNYDKLACAICDLNHLKYVNDTYGHVIGDNYIYAAAKILKDHMKHADKIYRIGGDEFAIIYKNDGIHHIEEDIRDVKLHCIEASIAYQIPLEIAIGYSVLVESLSFEDMIKQADSHMYADKRLMKTTSQLHTH